MGRCHFLAKEGTLLVEDLWRQKCIRFGAVQPWFPTRASPTTQLSWEARLQSKETSTTYTNCLTDTGVQDLFLFFSTGWQNEEIASAMSLLPSIPFVFKGVVFQRDSSGRFSYCSMAIRIPIGERVNMHGGQKDNGVHLAVALPGLRQKDLDLKFKNPLTITGTRSYIST